MATAAWPLPEAARVLAAWPLCTCCSPHGRARVQGFQQQVRRWPQQPLERAIAWVSDLPSSARVADFGCGDAQLARSVPHSVTSLDLVAVRR